MGKLDTLFLKVINDDELVKAFDINPDTYKDLASGKRSINPYVKAIAEILEQINLKVESEKSMMRIKRKVDSVVLDDAYLQTVYRKIVTPFLKK